MFPRLGSIFIDAYFPFLGFEEQRISKRRTFSSGANSCGKTRANIFYCT